MKKTRSSISLGQALAVIRFENGIESLEKLKLNPDDIDLLQEIKVKLNSLNDENSRNERVDQKNEEQVNNWLIDIFSNAAQEKSSTKKIELINNSFHLFEKFNRVFADYLMKTEDLKKEYYDQ